MGAFSRLRYVIAANVNSLIEKAEDPEKLLRALIREMEDASEEARVACAELLAEQQRLARLETQLSEEVDQWQGRAEKAVVEGRDDLARAALKAKAELSHRHDSGHPEDQACGCQDEAKRSPGRQKTPCGVCPRRRKTDPG
jgi:phage shock protein A